MFPFLRRWFGRPPAPSPSTVDVPDSAFLGAHGAWTAPEFLESVPDLEATGLWLAGPGRLIYAEALSTENLFGGQALPQFVVCGRYTFETDALRTLGADPNDAIHLVVRGPQGAERQPLSWWVDTYEYEAIGIDSHPAPSPPWTPPGPGHGFVSTGGYFNIPLGLHAPDPHEQTYVLEVWAECGQMRSNTVTISVE